MELSFEKNKELFNKNLSTGIKIESEIDEEWALALKDNVELQTLSLPIVIGDGNVTASAPEKGFQFKEAPNVSIDGDANLKVAIYDNVSEVLEELSNHELKVELPALNESQAYGLFLYGYKIDGNINGEWPLGSTTLTTGVDAGFAKRAAVIATLNKSSKIRKAIIELISEFRSPKQVEQATDLNSGTYLVMEREGSLKANMESKVGFDFDWAKEIENPNLSGSLGLQAKLGAQLDIGFNLAGNFNLMVSRPTEAEKVNLKLYKRNLKGWNFAAGIDASAKGELSKELTEIAVDDLIKATIGIHNAQIFEDIRKYIDPDKLESNLHGLTDNLLEEITDSDTFDKAKDKLKDLFEKWDAVGNEGGMAIINLIEEKTDVDLNALKNDFNSLATANVAEFLEEKLQKTGFHDTDFGKVLGDIVPFDDLFEILADQDLVEKLQTKASGIAKILDAQELVKKLHQQISEKLSLDKIKEVAASGNLNELGDWLKGKLSEFVKDKNDTKFIKELRAINAFIDKLHENAGEILKKVKKALQKEYGVSFSASYQKEKEHSALIDAAFDFTENPEISKILEEVIDGDYKQLLSNTEIKGIHLTKGVLTHGLKKQKTLSLTIPGTKRNFSRINQSIATGTFIDEIDGRLMMYELDASDTIQRNKRLIQVALRGDYFGKKKGNSFGVEKSSLKLSFDFKLQHNNLKTRHLKQIIEPFIETNLKEQFTEAIGTTKDAWIDEIDDTIELSHPNGKNTFGKTLLNLNLKAPSTIGNAWLNAPKSKNDPKYIEVSKAIQIKMRELVRVFAFEDKELFTKNYKRERLQAVLLYSALPVLDQTNYNYHDLTKSLGKITSQLARNIVYMVKKLQNEPDKDLHKVAESFSDISENVHEIINKVNSGVFIESVLKNIVNKEQSIVRKIRKSAIEISGIKELAADHPEKALVKLEKFGVELTETLNDVTVGFISIRKDYSRFMGPNLFIAVSKALDPTISDNTTGYLELMVLKEGSDFEMKSYLNGDKPGVNDLIVSQMIVDLQ